MADPMTPEWWVKRLYKKLLDQRAEFDFFNDYYTGNHPLPWLAPQARDEFRRILQMTRSNYMGLVVDAMVERANVEGFRLGGEDTADEETWRIWQANHLDADSDMCWLESGISGRGFLLAAPNPKDTQTPFLWVEHPSQCVVEYEPGTNRRTRRAGLKVWDDDWTQEIHATLYLMVDGAGLQLFKYKAPRPRGGERASLQWEPRTVAGEDWPAAGRMDRVPLIEVPNNPRLLTGGVSELYDVTDIQDRINKTLADRLITQDYGAFPQKWISAWPEEDEDGNPNTIDIGRNRAVTTEVEQTKFGQWDSAPLDPYSTAKREDVKDIASRTRTPSQYLLGEMSNVNGETLKASESGLVSKVRNRSRAWAEAVEEAVSLARSLAGLSTPPQIETIWTDPQYRTEGERTDAAVKRLASGISSLRQAREDVGYSQTQIRQLEQDDVTEGALNPAARGVLTMGGADAAAGGE
ncbi:MAG TPA: phage portal protein [Solirubrobacteraceae bacterium]|nr:phage portal protein [Solirubrobacteraceae bacterium]